MDILSLILEIRFSQRTPLQTVEDKRQKLLHAIAVEQPQKRPFNEQQGMELNHTPTKTRIVVEENRIAIGVEVSDISEAKKQLVETLKTIYNDVNYETNSISRIGVRTKWIITWDKNFTSLVQCYRDAFYKDAFLIREATDVAVALTLTDDNCKVNYSTGPMKPKEGLQHLVFKNRKLPHDFVFIDIDRYNDENPPQNNLKAIIQFVSNSIEHGVNKAKETSKVLLGEEK